MENKTIVYLILFLIAIYFLCTKRENMQSEKEDQQDNGAIRISGQSKEPSGQSKELSGQSNRIKKGSFILDTQFTDMHKRMYDSENNILENNLFLPRGIVAENETLPNLGNQNEPQVWYYGFPSKKQPGLSGFKRIELKPGQQNLVCNNDTFGGDPSYGNKKICFRPATSYNLEFTNRLAYANEDGNFTRGTLEYVPDRK